MGTVGSVTSKKVLSTSSADSYIKIPESISARLTIYNDSNTLYDSLIDLDLVEPAHYKARS